VVIDEHSLDGIQAQFRGHAAEAPRVRFTPQGETLWEFGVSLADSWLTQTETVVVRVPDAHYHLLRRWVVPGRQVLVRGTLHPVRWTGKDGKDRVRLLVEPTLEITPLDQKVRGSEPAGLDYRDRKMLQRAAYPSQGTTSVAAAPTRTERAARMRAAMEEEETP
jgi:single-stranded DNA-binding protein